MQSTFPQSREQTFVPQAGLPIRRFSLAYLTVADCGPVEAIRVAAMAGYDMIGLRMLPAIREEAPLPLFTDDRVLRDTAAALADTGIAVGDIELIRLGPVTDPGQFTALFERVQYLGAHHVIVISDDPDEGRLTECFARLCEHAAPFGVAMHLEPIPWTALRDLEVAAAVVETAGQVNAGVVIDALHFHRRRTPLSVIERLAAGRIQVFQICDAPAVFDPAPEALRDMARTARLLPGTGELDLAGLIARIPVAAIVSVEVPNQRLMRETAPAERARLAMQATRMLYASQSG